MNQHDWKSSVERLGDATATMRAELAVNTAELRRVVDDLKSIRESLHHAESGLVPRFAVIEEQVEQVEAQVERIIKSAPPVDAEREKARISARGAIISAAILAALTLVGVIITAAVQLYKK